MRRNAKTVNFGIIYGMSAFGLSERLNISRKEAADIIYQYFDKYPKIKQYMENQKALQQHGYVETLLKRRRYIRDIHSKEFYRTGFCRTQRYSCPYSRFGCRYELNWQ